MGFYGTIVDRANNFFKFDKIFNSRYEMDLAAANGTDNIFAGHFVLVQYDPDGKILSGDFYTTYKDNNDIMYADIDLSSPLLYTTFSQVEGPEEENWEQYWERYDDSIYLKIPSKDYFNLHQINYYTADVIGDNLAWDNMIVKIRSSLGAPLDTYYKCTGQDKNGIATWEEVFSDDALYGSYFKNYFIDRDKYNLDSTVSGYDATVWEKIYDNKVGRFRLIAHLNGMMPGIQLFADAPSLIPTAPYLDSLSTDALYRIHTPTHWGLAIKQADQYEDSEQPLSDQTVSKITADGLTLTYPGDIYFNLGGAEKNNYHKNSSHRDDETPNEILLTPTGESGLTYYDKDNQPVKKDTLELSIHLPVVGNMIDDGYDLLYGQNEDGTRPLDINWYNGNADEDIKTNGNPKIGGKTYSLNTMAGSLNTIHNILGQITVPLNYWPSQEDITRLSSDYLYIYNNGYYRKGKKIKAIDLDNNAFTYTNVGKISESDFKGNKYYIKNGSEFFGASQWREGMDYYLKNINPLRYQHITLRQYRPNTYYLIDGENYIIDSSDPLPSYPERTYYQNIRTITYNPEVLYSNATGNFYNQDENGNYIPAGDISPRDDVMYYTIQDNNIRPTSDSPVYWYYPGVYYRKINNEYILIEDSMEEFDNSNYSEYWLLTFSTEPKYGLTDDGEIIEYYPVVSNPPPIRVNQLYNLYTIVGANYRDVYIKYNNSYIKYDNIQSIGKIDGRNPYIAPWVFYRLNITGYTSADLFIPGVYYKKENGSYSKAYEEDWTNGIRTYYRITGIDEVEEPFYLPGKYWYEVVADEFELSETEVITLGLVNDLNENSYYTKTQCYVKNDELNQCPRGYMWSDYAIYVPPSITLYTQEEIDDLILISEFGETTSSLYGLFLEFSKLYEKNNEDTRNINSLRGALNTVKDLLYQIKKLKPGQILYVNDFGQIDSSENININNIMLRE